MAMGPCIRLMSPRHHPCPLVVGDWEGLEFQTLKKLIKSGMPDYRLLLENMGSRSEMVEVFCGLEPPSGMMWYCLFWGGVGGNSVARVALQLHR